MEPKVTIYALDCPLTHQVRYVGQSTNPRNRVYWHMRARDNSTTCTEWIESLKEQGLRPGVCYLARVPKSQARQVESQWIHVLRFYGHDLTNIIYRGAARPSLRRNP